MAKESIAFGGGRDVPGRVALRDVFEARYAPLVTQLYGLTGDLREAEQLAQEACVRAAAAERRFRRAADRDGWLRAAAVAPRRSRARRSLLRRRSSLRRRRPHREGSPPETAAPDFDELVCRGVRRRTRRRSAVVAAAYGIAVVAGAVALVDHEPPPRPPASTTVPMRPGPTEVEEVGDRIPPGRAGMPAAVPGAPANVTVEIPSGRLWRESSTGSGVYSPIRRGTAWLKVATFLVDGVVGRPCRTSSVDASPGIPAAFERPGVTRDALTDAIAGLPRADVSIPAHTEARWGALVVHVSVQMPRATCRNGNLLWTFDTRRSGEFVGNDHARLDFWITELDGRPLVIEAEQPMGSRLAERRELARVLDSIDLDGRPPG